MEIRQALAPVIGELVVDKLHTYIAGLVVEDLLLRSKDTNDWQRYLALESVVELMHRTDSRYPRLRTELAHLKKKHRAKINRLRKQLLNQYK